MSSSPSLSQHQALCIKWPKYWCFSFRLSPSNGGNVTGALINTWKRGVIPFEILSCWKIEDLYTFRAWAKLVANKMAQKGHGLHQRFSTVGPFTPGEHFNGRRHFGSLKLRGRYYWHLVSKGQDAVKHYNAQDSLPPTKDYLAPISLLARLRSPGL